MMSCLLCGFGTIRDFDRQKNPLQEVITTIHNRTWCREKHCFRILARQKKTSLLESFSTRVSVVDQEMRGSTVHFLARLKTQADIPLNIG